MGNKKSVMAQQVHAKCTFDYAAVNDDELSLRVGDIVIVTSETGVSLDDGWWEGVLNGKTGCFPSNYVSKCTSSSSSSSGATGGAQPIYAKALYDYEASKADELSFAVGSLITGVTVHAGGGWWEGTCNGRTGWFPDNFVARCTPSGEDEVQPANPASAGVLQHAKCKFDYDAVNADELSLRVGDIVIVTMEADDGWWKGNHPNGSTGVFPSNFVEKCAFSGATTIYAKALFDYEASNADELSFAVGSLITEVTAHAEGGWWEGTFNGRAGWFPDNFVEKIVAVSVPSTPAAAAGQHLTGMFDDDGPPPGYASVIAMRSKMTNNR